MPLTEYNIRYYTRKGSRRQPVRSVVAGLLQGLQSGWRWRVWRLEKGALEAQEGSGLPLSRKTWYNRSLRKRTSLAR